MLMNQCMHTFILVIFQSIKYIIFFLVCSFLIKKGCSVLYFHISCSLSMLCVQFSLFPVPCFPFSRSLFVSTISPRKGIAAAVCWIASTTICSWKGVAATLRLASSFPKLGWKGIPDITRRVGNTTSCYTNTCNTKSCCRERFNRTSPHPLNPCKCIWLWHCVEALRGESGGAVDRGSAQGGRVDKVSSFRQTRGSHSN